MPLVSFFFSFFLNLVYMTGDQWIEVKLLHISDHNNEEVQENPCSNMVLLQSEDPIATVLDTHW